MAPDRDILDLEPQLVSPLCGLVRRFHRIYKDPLEPELPFIWRAEISNHLFAEQPKASVTTASGKGLTEQAARRGALGEAVERYSALAHPPRSRLTWARRAELPGASLDPRDLVLYAPEQYPALGYDPWREDRPIGWVAGETLGFGAPIWLPAQAVYLAYQATGGDALAQPTSNGLAAGPTRDFAALRAALEVVERDAFVIAWCNRLPAARTHWDDLPDEGVVGLARAYERRGVAIELLRLPSDHDIPVFAALGVEDRPGGVAVVVGLGADLSPARAAASAILEVAQVRPALRMKLRDPELIARRDALAAQPQTVAELEDHDLLYTDRRMIPAFDMWRQGPTVRADWRVGVGLDPAEGVAVLVESLAAVGARAHLHDLTPPDIAGLGLRTVRVVVEDFQPIHFGHAEIRLAGRRLYDMPRRLGLRPTASTAAELNPLPHPLA